MVLINIFKAFVALSVCGKIVLRELLEISNPATSALLTLADITRHDVQDISNQGTQMLRYFGQTNLLTSYL